MAASATGDHAEIVPGPGYVEIPIHKWLLLPLDPRARMGLPSNGIGLRRTDWMNTWIEKMIYGIVLADDHPMIRQYIRQLLADRPDLEVVGEAEDGVALLQLLVEGSVNPALIIVDITMPRLEGIEAGRWIHALYPDKKLLILTMHKDPYYLTKSLAAGASGYLVKEDAGAELLPAIEAILEGRTYISSSLSAHPM